MWTTDGWMIDEGWTDGHRYDNTLSDDRSRRGGKNKIHLKKKLNRTTNSSKIEKKNFQK